MGKLGRAFLLVMAVCFLSVAGSGSVKAEEAKIASGIYIGPVYVGEMTAEEAEQAIDAYVDKCKNAVFTLTAGKGSIEFTAGQFGLTAQTEGLVEEALSVGKSGNLLRQYKEQKELRAGAFVLDFDMRLNEDTVMALLNENAAQLDVEAVNSGLTREDGEFKIVEGRTGVKVDVAQSADTICRFFRDGWSGENVMIALNADVVQPKGTPEQLARVKDVLGSYHTNYSTSAAGRCTNIAVAASKINGAVLYPGDEFSVGKTINPMTPQNGYELAGAYENGQTVQSYGGGVCQVSSTLYNAVILAELEVTQRSNHSMIVTYVKPSMDAAIAGDYKDFKFKNNTDAPIYIEGYTEGKDVYFKIYGEETRPANRVVSYESEVVSQDDPPVQYVATADPIGVIATAQSKHTGYVARLWKIVTVDGVEQSREQFNKSTYKASPKIVRVGTASADFNATAAVNMAVATQDEATIYAVVGQYAAVPAVAPQQPQEQQPQ